MDLETGEAQTRATLDAASAVVFAGRSVAISTPVRGGFALFVPRSTIAGHDVGVQPVGDDYRSKVGTMPGVISSLRPYRPNVIALDGTSLPEGLSLGRSSYLFHPVEGAGYRVVIGSEATVYVTGILVDRFNRHLGLAVGRAVDASGREQLFFTDESGYFEIHELQPGRYRLVIGKEQSYAAQIEIPSGQSGHVPLGPVVAEREGEQ